MGMSFFKQRDIRGEVLETKNLPTGNIGLLVVVHVGERELRRWVEVISIEFTKHALSVGEFDYRKTGLSVEDRVLLEATAVSFLAQRQGIYVGYEARDLAVMCRPRAPASNYSPDFSLN
jgi:hypothetical protein